MSIGSRIHNRRIELGLSADDLALRLGKNRATIYRYEGDEIENFPVSVIGPLANALYVSPAYLMGWSKDKELHDSYSDVFRSNLADELGSIDPQSFIGEEDVEEEYNSLLALLDSSSPLSLREACEVSDKLGRTMSYMLGEIDDEMDVQIRKMSFGRSELEPKDEIEEELLIRLKQLDAGQRSLLLATLKIAAEQNQGTLFSAQGTSGEKV